ncbi:MAG: transglutaminase family protein [Bacteroidota bacterium]|nr:hypothetical protein [Candidatus Kapabacteria bacterium]MDW8219870.1 transglutaminase family protein [Bacteroidota bacterium]
MNAFQHGSNVLLLLPQGATVQEFNALCVLLDDPDPHVHQAAQERLIQYGPSIVPALRAAIESIHDDDTQQRMTDVVRYFQRKAVDDLRTMVYKANAEGKDIDLEEMFLTLSRFGYPETDEEAVRKELDAIALRVHSLFMKSPQHTELSLLLNVNRAFFEEARFTGADNEHYHNPDNTYVQAILQTRRGIPISLCVLYLLVAERADVVMHGIGMPAHFVVYHPELDIFIDTFGNGAFLSREDCRRFIQGAGFTFEPSMLERVSNVAILLRMIRNLVFAYGKMHNRTWEIEALQELSAAILEIMNQEEE